jgi:peptidoglycan/LPS O-acetylase OafA/YrhL
MTGFEFRKNNFDLLRLLAALQVVFIHAGEHLQINSYHSVFEFVKIFPGVPIFFTISGFLISASLARSLSLLQYYKNRFLRVFPGLWVCFAISVISVVLVAGIGVFSSTSSKSILLWVAAQLSVGQFYNPDFLRNYGVGVLNGSLWTIPVELQFYVLLPIFFFMFRNLFHRRQAIFLPLVILALIVVNQLYIYYKANDSLLTKLIAVTVIPYLYMFLWGVFLQLNLKVVETWLAGKFLYWLLVFLFCSFILQSSGFNIRGNYINPLSALLLGTLIISFAYTYVNSLGHLLRGNDLSYGAYIYHMVVINAFVALGFSGRIIYLLWAVLTTLLVASFSWYFVESPSLKLKSLPTPNKVWQYFTRGLKP